MSDTPQPLKDVLDDATKQAQEALNEITARCAEAINQKLIIDDHIQGQQETIARYNKRNQDLATLYALKELLEAQSPKADTGTETIYESALNVKSQDEIAEVIGLVVKSIKTDYTKKGGK